MKQIQYLPGAGKEQTSLLGDLGADREYRQSGLADYAAAQKKRAGLYDTEGALGRSQLQNLFTERSGDKYDPLTVERTLRSERLADLNRFATDLAAQGRRAENLGLANLGYSGGRSSSFVDSARQNRIASNLAPQFGNIIAGLTPAVSGIVQGRGSQLDAITNLINQRLGLIGLGEGIELTPAQAAQALTSGQISNLGGLIDTAKQNVAGFQKESNWADKAAGVAGGLGQVAGGIADLYTGGALGAASGIMNKVGQMNGGGGGAVRDSGIMWGSGGSPNFSGAGGTGVPWLNTLSAGMGRQLPNFTSVDNWGQMTPFQQADYLRQIRNAPQGDFSMY